MKGTIVSSGLSTSIKIVSLSKHTKHPHISTPVAPNIAAPAACIDLSIQPLGLETAVTCTMTTLDDAPKELLESLQQNTLFHTERLLKDGSAFDRKPYFKFLGSKAGSRLAVKVADGTTHFYFEASRCVWRANAVCLSSSFNHHADFIYDGGNVAGHVVVLVEAQASFAEDVTAEKNASAARQRHVKPVKSYIAAKSTFGKIINGYSISFFSKPTTAGNFLSLAETRILKLRKKSSTAHAEIIDGKQPAGTPTPIVLAAHRSNSMLMGVQKVVDWNDWLRTTDTVGPKQEQVSHLSLRYTGRICLTSATRVQLSRTPPRRIEKFFDHHYWWLMPINPYLRASQRRADGSVWFGIEEKGGTESLNGVYAVIQSDRRQMPSSFVLQTSDPTSFGFVDGYGVALSIRDGGNRSFNQAQIRADLALLGDPFRYLARMVELWSLKGGIFSEAIRVKNMFSSRDAVYGRAFRSALKGSALPTTTAFASWQEGQA